MNRIILALILIQLAGCSSNPSRVVTEEPKVSSKKRYIEDVFRRQNQAMSQIILLPVDELDQTIQQSLIDAEQSVTILCKVLNDIASLHSEGKKESVVQKLKVSRSIKDCEKATLALELVLQQARDQLSSHDEI